MATLVGPVRPSPGARLARGVLALLGIVLATGAGQLIASRWGTEPVVLLYLLPVLGAAIFAGLWPSLATALVATLAYNFYFTRPYHTLLIDRPADLMTVGVLFAVAVLTSSLAGSLREQTQLAAAHAARNATIAGFAGRMLGCSDTAAIFAETVHEIGRLFQCRAAVVRADAAGPVASTGQVELSPADVAAAGHTIATGEEAGRGASRAGSIADWLFVPLSAGGAVVAALGLAREDGAPPVAADQRLLLASLLDQTALALQRAAAEDEARALAALRERDGMRDALLASIGRDVKPSLNAIADGVHTLRRAGAERSTVAAVATEVTKLDRYVDNLLDVTPEADREPIAIGPVTIDLYRRVVSKGDDEVHLSPKEFSVLAELAKHAGRVLTHKQLLRVVWGPAREDQVDYLRVAIRALRQKIEDDPAHPRLILNEPAVGYRLALA